MLSGSKVNKFTDPRTRSTRERGHGRGSRGQGRSFNSAARGRGGNSRQGQAKRTGKQEQEKLDSSAYRFREYDERAVRRNGSPVQIRKIMTSPKTTMMTMVKIMI